MDNIQKMEDEYNKIAMALVAEIFSPYTDSRKTASLRKKCAKLRAKIATMKAGGRNE